MIESEPLSDPIYYFKNMEIKTPKMTQVNPTENDYTIGTMMRYFCRQSNNIMGVVIEIDKDQYDSLNIPLYVKVSVPWKLTGTRDEVKKKNMLFIEKAENEMLGIKKHLSVNLLKFFRG